mmetsp:Transcript_22170/g.31366  ORF Transcript_22170/g.31366 Transcript_22170/m.31366 type:complete len:252 (-) Transcript_22170:24-779(-)
MPGKKKKKEEVVELTPAEKCQKKLQEDLDAFMDLVNASYYGIVKSVQKVLDTGKAKVDEADPESGHPPLVLACRYGHLQVAQTLIQHGADANKAGYGGLTALHAACRGDHNSIVEWLCNEVKVALDAEDDAGNTALNEAARMGNLKCMDTVATAGGNLEHANHAGTTPFMTAVLNCRGAIVDILIKKGVDINTTDTNGNSALHLAAMCGYPKVVRQLLVNNINVAQVNSEGKKAEEVAANAAIQTSISAYE